MTVRPALPGDAEALEALWHRLLEEQGALDGRLQAAADARSRWRNDFPGWVAGDRSHRLFAAEDEGGAVVGFAGAMLWAPPPIYEGGLEVYLNEIYVAPPARRKGAGRALVEAVRAWAAEKGGARLRFGVLEANAAGQAFWKACGARPFVVTMTLETPAPAAPAARSGKPGLGFLGGAKTRP